MTLAVGGKVTTYRWAAGNHTVTWKPPPGLAPGTYPVQVSAVSYAGPKQTVTLAPIAVQWETAPPAVTTPPTLVGTTLTWAFAIPAPRGSRSRSTLSTRPG